MKAENKEIYTVLAEIYDAIMADVDYESWADYLDEIIQTHHPNPVDVMELACGTGSITLALHELGVYRLSASDASSAMIEQAKEKARQQNADIRFSVMDFGNIRASKPFDIIFSVFDSVNYLHTHEQILKMIEDVNRSLKPGGLFIFDFSTPQNSLEAVEYLNNEEGYLGNFHYYRESTYLPAQRVHYNIFDIEELAADGKTIVHTYREMHKQRVYSLSEMLSIIEQSPCKLIAKYEDFNLIDAGEKSTRITMVLECQKQL